MRPIRIGKTEYQVEKPKDAKGRPGKVLVARCPDGNVVATNYTRAGLHADLEGLR